MGALTALTLLGCGGDSKPSEGESDAGGPERRPTEQQCQRPEDMTEVLAPSVLGSGASIGQLVVDGSLIYFNVGTILYRVATEGGQAEEIFSDGASYGLAFSAQNGRVLVATDTEVLELSAGGEPHVLAQLPEAPASDLLSSAMPFVFADQLAYFASSTSIGEGATLYSVDLVSGLSTSIGVASDDISALAYAGDSLYWSEYATDASAPYENVLKRMPVSGGQAQVVAVDLGKLHLSFEVMGATSDSVMLDVSLVIGEDNSDNSAVTAAGIYRQPIAGGPAVQLVESSAIDVTSLFGFLSTRQVVQAGNDLYMRLGTLAGASIYSLSAGASMAEKRFCVTLREGLLSAMAVVGNSVYLAVAGEEESSIVRRDL